MRLLSSSGHRADDIAARITAVGCEPQVKRQTDQIRVEADVPDEFPVDAWLALLAVLTAADRYGLNTGDDGMTVWAAVHTEPPRRGDSSGGMAISCKELNDVTNFTPRSRTPGGE